MKKITRSALLPYSDECMFDLVNNVATYPEFLPWCGGSEVISETNDKMVASILIAKAGIKHQFKTENHLERPKKIELHLLEGPFKSLYGLWEFQSINTSACKISLEIEFEINNSFLDAAIGVVFEQIVASLVQSFCNRAKQVYG
ncbi:MAG: ubiquinone-binding protein [Piscirickettsiaceae bacterium CG_4_9_14_3_um_filter_43_564]|nr:type II toxin-antitoxin system RatA family toxin [Thiomicrospira sp.]OIP96618.1 MAG: ubiquinone-binding protein [Thiomicrospira sp. CG2_30_44_34]PIQ06485.1 MAG: ubiquinone-binding protein [Piscirickettsiaceae bacterium CG18_big_fil_WC_8_21_14_2_50_44_103]PIU39182.1 MAG: ubiquinone-binding protein [Piscirickettsiaceae bacterium CG07_land_8_20_14_0_80_44_28]PIW78053.1 MAG: ubiquinone-binding protein [Piscirickettsiaceae bacterium CG_4_8_14_3_um_filter_44_38]PIX78709.1 MAG: ubiquinone-binding 